MQSAAALGAEGKHQLNAAETWLAKESSASVTKQFAKKT